MAVRHCEPSFSVWGSPPPYESWREAKSPPAVLAEKAARSLSLPSSQRDRGRAAFAVPGTLRHFRAAGITRLVRSRAWPSPGDTAQAQGVGGAGDSSRCTVGWPCGGHTPACAVTLGPQPSRPPCTPFGISSTIPLWPKSTGVSLRCLKPGTLTDDSIRPENSPFALH